MHANVWKSRGQGFDFSSVNDLSAEGVFFFHFPFYPLSFCQTSLTFISTPTGFHHRKIRKSVGDNEGVNNLLKDSRGKRKSKKEGSR